MILRHHPTTLVLACSALLVLGLSACGGTGDPAADGDQSSGAASGVGTAQAGGSDTPTVAFLLKENKTARWEAFDRPMFTDALAELCPECDLLYNNAQQDSTKQQSQAEAALANGADVLVMTPVDSAAAASIATMAKDKGVPVIAYDALILNADIDYFVSFLNERVGELQGEALVDRLAELGSSDPQIVMINGSPTDANASQFKSGAHSALDGKVTIGKEYDTPDWSPDKAQQEMEQAITALGKDKIAGVYAANDGTAGGAIAAMRAAGLDPLPPVTGQDAELAGIQRIVTGEQYMTVYKAIAPEARAAAELTVALLKDQTPSYELVEVDNGYEQVPSVLLDPVAVTQDNIADTVVADGFYTVEQICTAEFANACAAIGLE